MFESNNCNQLELNETLVLMLLLLLLLVLELPHSIRSVNEKLRMKLSALSKCLYKCCCSNYQLTSSPGIDRRHSFYCTWDGIRFQNDQTALINCLLSGSSTTTSGLYYSRIYIANYQLLANISCRKLTNYMTEMIN